QPFPGRAWTLPGYILLLPQPRRRSTPCNFLVPPGNGRKAPTCPTPATGQHLEPWASTTASSCAISRSCAAAPVPPPPGTAVPVTGTSSTPTTAGSSPAFGWRGTFKPISLVQSQDSLPEGI